MVEKHGLPGPACVCVNAQGVFITVLMIDLFEYGLGWTVVLTNH